MRDRQVDPDKLLDLLAERHMTVKEFSDRVGVHPTMVHHVLAGRQRFGSTNVRRAARVLGCAIEDVTQPVGDGPPHPAQLIMRDRQVDPDKLYDLLVRRRMSNKEFGELMGLSTAMVQYVLAGKRQFRELNARRATQVLNCTIEDFTVPLRHPAA